MARADYECCSRAGKSTAISVEVQGWRQSSGAIWVPGLLVTVRSPDIDADGVNMIVHDTEWRVGNNGELTRMKLLRSDAYLQQSSGEVEDDFFDE